MNKWAALLIVFPVVFLAIAVQAVTGLETFPSFLIAALVMTAVYTALALRLDSAFFSALFSTTAITLAVLTVLAALIWVGRRLSGAGMPDVVAWAVPIAGAVALIAAFVKWGMPMIRKASAARGVEP